MLYQLTGLCCRFKDGSYDTIFQSLLHKLSFSYGSCIFLPTDTLVSKKYKEVTLYSPPSVARRANRPSLVVSLLLLTPCVPLLLGVWGTGQGESEGSPQGLRGGLREVEQRTRGHHRVIRVASGLDGRQKNGVHRLDLRQMRQQLQFGLSCCEI